ncbi:MAG: DNA repair exonuclease, partial [Nitrospira sp.]
ELVRLVDSILSDEAELARWAQSELGELLSSVPQEVAAGDVPKLDDLTELRSLVLDAEATVLARLTVTGEGA